MFTTVFNFVSQARFWPAEERETRTVGYDRGREEIDDMTPPVVPIDVPVAGPRQTQQQQRFPSQRPYKYGMIMLCLGALINWLALAENYIEPVRYIGVACIVTGAMLIIAAMCCWMNSNSTQQSRPEPNTDIHVIEISDADNSSTKPPDYETVTGAPPSYDVAIKLDPAHLLVQSQESSVTQQERSPPPSYSTSRIPV